MLAATGCGDGGPTGIPYADLGRYVAGVYKPATESGFPNMRLVMGTRHTLTGRYDGPNGVVRFEGTWKRVRTRVFLTLTGQPGLPSEITFDITREEILTELPRSPFSMEPETAPPDYLREDIMRLKGPAQVAGSQVTLDLIRVIVDIAGGGGGLTAN